MVSKWTSQRLLINRARAGQPVELDGREGKELASGLWSNRPLGGSDSGAGARGGDASGRVKTSDAAPKQTRGGSGLL